MLTSFIVLTFCSVVIHLFIEIGYEPLPPIARAIARGGIALMLIGVFAPGSWAPVFVAGGGLIWSSVIAIMAIKTLWDRYSGIEGEA